MNGKPTSCSKTGLSVLAAGLAMIVVIALLVWASHLKPAPSSAEWIPQSLQTATPSGAITGTIYYYLPTILKNYGLATGPAARGFLMGVAGLIPRNFPNSSADDWLNLYETLPETGELLGVYTNWADSSETAGQIPGVVSTQFGLAPRYNFTPLVALGFHRDVPGGGLEPTLSWADPIARGQFKQAAVSIAEQYQPAHLALGVEVNRFYEYDPAAFNDFVSAYAGIYDAIKAVSPHTLVFPIFQLEMTKGGGYLLGGSEEREPQWELLDRFGERLDLAAFTTYPFFDYPSPADLPADYYAEIGTHTPRPLAFTEIGWPSAPLVTAPGSEYGGDVCLFIPSEVEYLC